jgi:RHS repeat-associated protein
MESKVNHKTCKETGLHNYKARMYDSSIMQFLSIDPLHEFANPYSYVGSNPINFTDPTGEVSWQVWGVTQLSGYAACAILLGTPLFFVGAAGIATLIYLDAMTIYTYHYGNRNNYRAGL